MAIPLSGARSRWYPSLHMVTKFAHARSWLECLELVNKSINCNQFTALAPLTWWSPVSDFAFTIPSIVFQTQTVQVSIGSVKFLAGAPTGSYTQLIPNIQLIPKLWQLWSLDFVEFGSHHFSLRTVQRQTSNNIRKIDYRLHFLLVMHSSDGLK